MGMIDGIDLGQFGIWTGDFEAQQAGMTRESVQELDDGAHTYHCCPSEPPRERSAFCRYLR
jgi:hypothetical protein